jgi:uncharacterized membrane protein YfcA
MELWVATFAVLATAAAVQAASGFGFALVAVPFLALVIDPHTAVVGAAVASVPLNLGAVRRRFGDVRWRLVGGLLLAAATGLPVGLVLLRTLDDRALTLLVAGTVLSCTILVWRRLALRGRVAVVAGGVVAGVLTTATGTNGPPLAAVFAGLGLEPREFRASFGAYFAVSGVLTLAAYGVAGELTGEAWQVGAVGLVALPVGWFLGDRVFRRLDPVRFRRAVLAVLVTSAAVTAMRVVSG